MTHRRETLVVTPDRRGPPERAAVLPQRCLPDAFRGQDLSWGAGPPFPSKTLGDVFAAGFERFPIL